jgi:Uncharacterized protein conserved in bacteria
MKINFFLKGIVKLLGVLAICVLIWFSGASVKIGGIYLLKSVIVRTILITFVLIFCIVRLILYYLFLRKNNQKFISTIFKTSKTTGGEQDEEVKKYVNSIIKRLKKQYSSSGAEYRSLYELPRYLVFGLPSSGKTTLLKKIRVRFYFFKQSGATHR